MIAGTVDETPRSPISPPMSPLRTTTRTLAQTDQLLTTEARTMERSARMADVASETILLNKIKKKLDSVLVRLLSHDAIFLATCNTVLLLRDVNL